MPTDLPDHFGPDVAPSYDDPADERFTPAHLALESGFLAELAGPGGRALELAIGTGRVALPLAGRGVDVAGIDLSEAMVAELRAKPGGDRIPVSIGDFAAPPTPVHPEASTASRPTSRRRRADSGRRRSSRPPAG